MGSSWGRFGTHLGLQNRPQKFGEIDPEGSGFRSCDGLVPRWVLGSSWGGLGPLLGALGPSLEGLGGVLSRLEGVLGSLGTVLAAHEAINGSFWDATY